VIVITGPGRSGTSFLAALYRELGFDPGGGWNPEAQAGLERGSFIRANMELADALGVVAAPEKGPRFLSRLSSGADHRLPPTLAKPVQQVFTTLRYHRTAVDLGTASDLDDVVTRFGERLRSLASDAQVAKDPRFCWTLQAWLASGAPISAVVVALRPLDAMVDSRIRAGMLQPEARGWAKSNFTYGIGLVMSAATEYRVPTVLLRFPDFLDEPRQLYERLPLPEERTWSAFEEAFAKVHDASLVHDHR
jgi:hypothetical protein